MQNLSAFLKRLNKLHNWKVITEHKCWICKLLFYFTFNNIIRKNLYNWIIILNLFLCCTFYVLDRVFPFIILIWCVKDREEDKSNKVVNSYFAYHHLKAFRVVLHITSECSNAYSRGSQHFSLAYHSSHSPRDSLNIVKCFWAEQIETKNVGTKFIDTLWSNQFQPKSFIRFLRYWFWNRIARLFCHLPNAWAIVLCTSWLVKLTPVYCTGTRSTGWESLQCSDVSISNVQIEFVIITRNHENQNQVKC